MTLKFISVLLIADAVSLSCSSGLKEFKISTLSELAKSLKACAGFDIFTFFSFIKFSLFLYRFFCLIVLYSTATFLDVL